MTPEGVLITAPADHQHVPDPLPAALRSQLLARTEALITQAADTTQPLAGAAVRKALDTGDAFIHEQFVEDTPASTLLALRTALLDDLLRRLWQNGTELFTDMALLAVGGYGRGELHPHSDIDIAILLPDDTGTEHDAALSTWITALWDLNLDIGHSVRTIQDCQEQAESDITVITNLMESRFLCGNPVLFAQMNQVIQPANMWSPADFFAAKIEEQNQRHSRFQTNAYRLEPNIKESQGGLRDFQTISWVCQRLFQTRSLEPLVEQGLLSDDEMLSLRDGLELLWRIRYQLHHVAGRREDRLLFDYQREVAHAFGHTDDTHNRSIETLMQAYYRTVMNLQRLNEILLQGIGGIISGVTARSDIEPVNKRFQIRNGFLEVSHDDVFMHYPPALLEVFVLFGSLERAEKIRSHTVRLIRANLLLINGRFRSDPVTKDLFLRIFNLPDKLTRTVRMMNRYGVMAAYIPAFEAIVGRMQYDLFHIYTVDEHTIGVIRNCRRLMLPRFAEELPHGHSVATQITRPHVLYLSALFHDIAKGRGGDHSELGAADAREFAEAHGLCEHDARLMQWTVRQHLLMSITAQRKDIDDPREQLEFARQVGTIERLNHLYILTIADIRATNPELWNSFKQSLLQSLYRHALLILQRGLDNPLEEDDVIARRQTQTLELLKQPMQSGSRLQELWQDLGQDYFRQYQADEIAWHSQVLLENENFAVPLVALRYSDSRGSTEILIYTPDDGALFALIATVFERLQLNVFSATINTTDAGYALDTFHVLDTLQQPIRDAERVAEIRHTLIHELGAPRDIPSLGAQRAPRRLRYFSVSTNVRFTQNDSGLTEIRITAADRPGILSAIARVFLNACIDVRAARITTLGEKIDDIFLVRNTAGQALSSEEQALLIKLMNKEL